MFDEFVKSFRSTMYERMSSTFLSSVVVFFVYFNWKAILVVSVGLEPIQERISVVEQNYVDFGCNVAYPIVSAAVASIAYPYISLVFFATQSWAVVLKKKLRNYFEKKSIVTVEQFMGLNEEVSKQKSRFSELLNQKDEEIGNLKLSLESLAAEKSTLESEKSDLKNQLGIQVGVFTEKYELFVEQAKVIVDQLKEQLSSERSRTVIALWLAYESKVHQIGLSQNYSPKDYRNSLNALRAWVDAVSLRVNSSNSSAIAEEVSAIMATFVELVESFRGDFKVVLEKSSTDRLRSSLGDPDAVREQWNNARDDLNEIIARWKALMSQCFPEDRYRSLNARIGKIFTIGDTAVV